MVLKGCWSVMMKSTLGRRAGACAPTRRGSCVAARPPATVALMKSRREMDIGVASFKTYGSFCQAFEP